MGISVESVKALLSSADLGDRLRAVNQIRELPPKAGWELIQIAIADSSSRVRYSAVSQLDTLGTEDLYLALQLLRDLLKDPEYDIQAAAADCLGALKLQAAFADLEELYQATPEWLVKFSIVATLGELGDPRGMEILQQALADNNGLIQTAAISSLGELGNQSVIPLIAPFANNPDWQIRYRLAQALVRLGGEEAKSILATLVDDEVEAIAREAKSFFPEPG